MLSYSRLICALLLTCSFAQSKNPTHTWTGKEGETIEAEYVRLQDRYAILKTEERTIRVPLRQLIDEDQQWIKAYEEFDRPRHWGSSGPDQLRGRFLEIRQGAAQIKIGREVRSLPLAKLTAQDRAHIAKLYEHTEEDLPEGIANSDASMSTPKLPLLGRTFDREWTDKTGRRITARYLGTRGPKVVMWRKEREFVYPIERLSDADQKWIAMQNINQLTDDLKSGLRAASSLMLGGAASNGPPPSVVAGSGAESLAPPPGRDPSRLQRPQRERPERRPLR